ADALVDNADVGASEDLADELAGLRDLEEAVEDVELVRGGAAQVVLGLPFLIRGEVRILDEAIQGHHANALRTAADPASSDRMILFRPGFDDAHHKDAPGGRRGAPWRGDQLSHGRLRPDRRE